MKTVKRIFIGVAALVAAFSLCAAAGCTNSSPVEEGAVEGNYREANSTQLQTSLDKVDGEKIAGDTTAEDYKFGLRFTTGLNASLSTSDGGSASGSVTSDFKVLLSGETLAGSGESTVAYDVDLKSQEGAVSTAVKQSAQYKVGAYIDDSYAYAKVDDGTNVPSKMKLDYMTLAGKLGELAGGFIPVNPAAEGDTQAPATGDTQAPSTGDTTTPEVPTATIPSAEVILQTMSDYKVTTTMDDENGLKLKFSASEETLWTIVAGSVGETEVAQYKSAITVNAFKLDIYLAFDANYQFEAASVVTDISVSVDTSKMPAPVPTAEEQTTVGSTNTFKLNGYVKFETYKGDVTLPKGLAVDPTYYDFTETLVGTIDGIIAGNENPDVKL